MGKEYKLTSEQIEAIEKAGNKGLRLEILPVKEGFKIMCCERHELQVNKPISK